MAHLLTLPTIAALSITGSLLGVHLGRGAVSEIDPLYMAPAPQTRFFADLVPGGYRPVGSDLSRPEDAAINDINMSGRPECFDCQNFVEAELAARDASTSAVFESSADQQAGVMPPEIQRYMSFPVTIEQAERPVTEGRDYAAGAGTADRSSDAIESDPINM